MLTQKQVLKKIERGEPFEGTEIGDVDFRYYIFEKDVNFYNALFVGAADFTQAEFKREARFLATHFEGDTHFMGTKFREKASFYAAQFHNKADFNSAQFDGEAWFEYVEFQNEVDFMNGLFKGVTYFIIPKFHRSATFFKARFQDKVYFVGGDRLYRGKTNVFSNSHVTDMREVFFQKPDQVIFQTVDLRNCLFSNTNLSKVEFTDIIWPIKGVSFHFYSRTVVYDEIIEKPEKEEYPFIEKLYRDLKKNYENRGSYGEAGDFHYGEMEMRRLSQKPVFCYVSLLWLYKTLSGYGEKYWRALFWLGAFLLVYLGAYRFIEYNALPFRDGLWNSLIHTLQVITFQTDRSYYPKTDWGTLADAGLKVFIPLQATLAILAIKRKFKR